MFRTLPSLLVLLAIGCQPAMEDGSDLSANGLDGLDGLDDLDQDGIADLDDNCPAAANDEQHDADLDGAGDACDLTLVMHDVAWDRVPFGQLRGAAIAVAEIYNFTDEPQPFAMWSDGDRILPEQESGVVEPGEIRTLYAAVDTRGLDFEMDLQALVGVVLADDEGETDAMAGTYPPPVDLCDYSIKRDSVKVVKGEGGADPALELNVDTTVFYGGGDTTESWSGTLKKGATYGTDETVYSSTVTVGTNVSHDWEVAVEEEDTWDADDHDDDSGNLSFRCSSAGGTLTDTALLHSLGNAEVDVKVKAVW